MHTVGINSILPQIITCMFWAKDACVTQYLYVVSVCADVGYDEAEWAAWYKIKFDGDVLISEYVTGKYKTPLQAFRLHAFMNEYRPL